MMQMLPLSSLSLIKCLPISVCLVLSCWNGLLAMLIAALLSHNGSIGPDEDQTMPSEARFPYKFPNS